MKKGRIIALLTAVLMLISLCGCMDTLKDRAQMLLGMKPDRRTNGTYVFTEDTMPKIGVCEWDSDLGEAFVSAVLGTDKTKEFIHEKKTEAELYRALCDGEIDIIIALSPTKEDKEYAEKADTELEFSEAARDGLVFLCNEDNPVSALTAGEIKRIYTGEITSWETVGGKAGDIFPFIRKKDAVTGKLFEKYVADFDTVKPATDYVFDEEAGLMKTEADYDAGESSLGYTLFSYITGQGNGKLRGSKLLGVNGTEPTAETVGNGSYFMSESICAVIRNDALKDSPERILYNYILSPQGREITAAQGYPVSTDDGER